jgi:hypothetical protein
MADRMYVLVAMAIAWLAQPAIAATWYVDNMIGSDDLNGRTAAPRSGDGPFRTIAMALAVAGKGDRVELAATPVPYRELISLSGPRHQGFVDRPFTIAGNGAVLDGTVVAEFGGWQPVGGDLFAMRPRRLTYQQLFSNAEPLERVTVVDAGDAIESSLQPKQWMLDQAQLLFKVESGKLPEDYELRHAGLQTGITLYNVRHVRIENLIVQGFHTDGINAHELVRDCRLEGVECRANGRSGLSVGGVSRVDVTGSHFYDNGRVQVRVEQQGKLSMTESQVDDRTAPKFQTDGGQLTVDGQQVDAPQNQ